MPLPFGHLGQLQGQFGRVVYSHHTLYGSRRSVKERASMTSVALLVMDVQQGIVDRFADWTASLG